jgi:hypothetical protein
MTRRILFCALLMLMSCFPVAAQQSSWTEQQPLTFWYEYHVNPGKESEFLGLVKAIGEPATAKLMADGVVLAWGVQTPVIRVPENPTHVIWYTVPDYAGMEKVEAAIGDRIAKMTEESGKSSATKKGSEGGPMARIAQITDFAKTHDYLTRDIEFRAVPKNAPAGTLPISSYVFVKVRPGREAEYIHAWEKTYKAVFDTLVTDGVVLAYGLTVEEVRTDGDFTHYTWFAVKDLASLDKVRAAFASGHSPMDVEAITKQQFGELVDTDAVRGQLNRSLIFRLAGQK